MHDDRLLTPEEVSTRLQVRQQTLAVWRVQRIGPVYIKVGRLVRYRGCDIQAFLDSNSVRCEPPET